MPEKIIARVVELTDGGFAVGLSLESCVGECRAVLFGLGVTGGIVGLLIESPVSVCVHWKDIIRFVVRNCSIKHFYALTAVGLETRFVMGATVGSFVTNGLVSKSSINILTQIEALMMGTYNCHIQCRTKSGSICW